MISVVISGNQPDPLTYQTYPDFIHFDGLVSLDYNNQELKKYQC